MYKKRIVDSILEDKLEAKGAVVIEGPKWCGKTTTALQVAKSVLRLDSPSMYPSYSKLGDIDPLQLLEGDTPRLLDEWQLVPKLWDAVRYEVDTRGKEGQFILTGSSVPVDSSEIKHSGTGRYTYLKMRTMSLYESGESNGAVSLSNLFTTPQKISAHCSTNINSLAYYICRGGWPHAIGMKEKPSLSQAFDYFDGVVNSDINRADGINKNPDRVRKIMRSFARNQGGQVSISSFRSDIVGNEIIDISDNTIDSYITALKRIYVIEDMRAWNPNLRSKTAIRTSDSRYYSDPSIAVAALGLGPGDLINDLNTFGFLFETLCVRDLRVYAEALGGEVFHYRDKTGLECDAVIHLRNGSYGLIEVKLGGENLINQASENLKKLASKIDTNKMKEPSFMMVLVGIGEYAYKREDGIYIVPICCLKN